MICPQCNHKNIDGVSNCEACDFPFPTEAESNDLGALLSQIDDEYELGDEEDDDGDDDDFVIEIPKENLAPMRMGSLAEIRGAIQGVIDKNISDEDLMEIVEDFQEEINEKLEEMDQMVFSPQMYDTVKKPVKVTRKAFELYDGVFNEIKLYFADKDTQHLLLALDLEEDANLHLSYAFNVLRETMTKFLGF